MKQLVTKQLTVVTDVLQEVHHTPSFSQSPLRRPVVSSALSSTLCVPTITSAKRSARPLLQPLSALASFLLLVRGGPASKINWSHLFVCFGTSTPPPPRSLIYSIPSVPCWSHHRQVTYRARYRKAAWCVTRERYKYRIVSLKKPFVGNIIVAEDEPL